MLEEINLLIIASNIVLIVMIISMLAFKQNLGLIIWEQ